MAKCKQCGKECKRIYCNYRCYWDSKKGKNTTHLKNIGFKKGSIVNIGRIRKDVTKRNLTNNPMWKNHKRIQTKSFRLLQNGYYLIQSKNHPKCDSKGYVREHRLIMEKYIGRYLRSDEIIHHKDFNKLNNKIENLKIMTKTEHMKLHNKNKNYNGFINYKK